VAYLDLSDTSNLVTGILKPSQGHSSDRSHNYWLVITTTCWAGLMKTKNVVVKML